MTRLWLVPPAALLALACGPQIKLSSPLTMKEYDKRVRVPMALHVPDDSRRYVETGHINVVQYKVYFGDALEANAAHAFSAAFDGFTVLDQFPPAKAPLPRLAIDVAIQSTNLSPGALTFMSSSATVDLKGTLAVDGVVQAEPIAVTGKGEASPGALGAVPGPFGGPNNGAYDQALQAACELAMGDALEKLVDATLARVSSVAAP